MGSLVEGKAIIPFSVISEQSSEMGVRKFGSQDLRELIEVFGSTEGDALRLAVDAFE